MNNYTPVDDSKDINEGTFDYKYYGRTVYRLVDEWIDNGRNDYILYEHSRHGSEFKDNIRIIMGVADGHKPVITGIVKKYWDCSCKE